MTSNTKGILVAVVGVGISAAVLIVLAIMIIGAGLMAAAAASGSKEQNAGNETSVTDDRDGRRRKHSGVSSNTSRAGTDHSTGGSLSPELVGGWLKREGDGETDFTGKSRYRSHRRYFYEFSPDGAVRYTTEKDVLTILQCEIKEKKTASGKASTDGDTLIVELGEADFSGSNSCEGPETTEKILPAETLRLKWRLKTEGETAAQICLEESAGEVCYNKQ